MESSRTGDEFVCPPAAGRRIAGELRALLELGAPELSRLYSERVPGVDPEALRGVIERGARHFRLCGVDLLRIDRAPGFVVIEVNSAPGFGYCTPGLDAYELAYRRTAEIVHFAAAPGGSHGAALLTEDKLPVETAGYRAALNDVLGYEVPVFGPAELQRARPGVGGALVVGDYTLRGGLRYLHVDPWRWLPPDAPGFFVNGTAVDLAGGRDKIAAAAAFERYEQSRAAGLPPLSVPRSWRVASESELSRLPRPLVVKEPRRNSGQGIRFLREEGRSAPLPGPVLAQELLLPRGAAPGDAAAQILLEGHVHDVRFVVGSGRDGFRPLMVYARKARAPFAAAVDGHLGTALLTNIAVARGGDFDFEYERLVVPTEEGWGRLALSRSDFAAAFIQSVLATVAVDDGVGACACAESAAS